MSVSRILISTIAITAFVASVFAQVSPMSPAPEARPSVTVEGRTTRIEVTKSHVTLYLDVPDSEGGKRQAWAIETGSLNELCAKGIKLTDLRVGRVIRAVGTRGAGSSTLLATASEISILQ